MLNTVKTILNNRQWQFTQVEEHGVLFFGISGQNGTFQCFTIVEEEGYKFIFVSVCGANTPTERKSEMLELLTRINYETFLGNFEMQYETGEVRFRTSIYYKTISTDIVLVDHLIMTNIMKMDNYLPAIMGVMFGGLTAIDAIKLIDKDQIK